MTINEIAKLADVSRTTVSRYLNKGYVSREKAERIKKVIEETGYQPSRQAQMLRTKQTKVVGVILPKLNSDSISRMVEGISIVLKEAGYQMLLANTSNHEEEELQFLKLFAANGSVDGVILIGTILTEEHAQIIEDYKLPIVVLGQKTSACASVSFDDYSAAKALTARMLETGEKIGYIGVTQRDRAAGYMRRQAYLDAFREAGRKPDEEAMVETGFMVRSGYEACRKLLDIRPDLDSIFCSTDSIAVGAMVYLREKQIRIPDQIQIVGTGDTEKGTVVTPPLTTAHYYYQTSGRRSAEQLLSLLSDADDTPRTITMGYEILERASLRSREQ